MPWSKDNLPDAVKSKKWSDTQIEAFVKTANAVLKETGDEGEAIATGIKQADGMTNAKDYPNMFYARHMRPGTARYTDANGEEVIRVDTTAIKKMAPTFNGKPVYVDHQNVNLENIQAEADGYVTDSFYNKNDGWFWVKMVVVSDRAKDAIKQGYGVSNAYFPTEWAAGGTLNNCDYAREVMNGEFSHLAIVDNPRYEEAAIFSPEEYKRYNEDLENSLRELMNSKTEKKGNGMSIKFWKKTEVQNASDADEAVAVMDDGSEVPVTELVNAYKASQQAKEEELQNKKMKLNMDDKVEVDGKPVTMKTLVESYQSKCNADEEAAKAEEEKANAEAEEEKKKEEEEKANSKHFDTVKNAIDKGKEEAAAKPIYRGRQEALAEGKLKY